MRDEWEAPQRLVEPHRANLVRPLAIPRCGIFFLELDRVDGVDGKVLENLG